MNWNAGLSCAEKTESWPVRCREGSICCDLRKIDDVFNCCGEKTEHDAQTNFGSRKERYFTLTSTPISKPINVVLQCQDRRRIYLSDIQRNYATRHANDSIPTPNWTQRTCSSYFKRVQLWVANGVTLKKNWSPNLKRLCQSWCSSLCGRFGYPDRKPCRRREIKTMGWGGNKP